jgi:hypothetical protein
MSGKELSKLVAFVKGTQFDLVVRKVFFFFFSKNKKSPFCMIYSTAKRF